MDVINPRCCGLDIHKRTVVACLIVPGPTGAPRKELRTFSTMTADLLALADWLRAAGCPIIAMESTGVYWKPLFNLLEDEFTVLLANAQHVKVSSAEYPHRQHDLSGCHGGSDRSRPPTIRTEAAAV